jgi:hypothetical protein
VRRRSGSIQPIIAPALIEYVTHYQGSRNQLLQSASAAQIRLLVGCGAVSGSVVCSPPTMGKLPYRCRSAVDPALGCTEKSRNK